MNDDYTLHDEGTPSTGPRLRISSTKSYSGSTRLIRTQVLDHEKLQSLSGSNVLLWCVLIIYILVDQFVRG